MATSRRNIVRDEIGGRILLTRVRAVELDVLGNDTPWFATNKDIRDAYITESGVVAIHSTDVSGNKITLTVEFGPRNIGCHSFSELAFNRILRNAGALKAKAAKAGA